MYPNFIEDRKALGFEVLKDTTCGTKLVLILNSTFSRLLTPSKLKIKLKKIYRNREAVYIFVRKLPSNVKDKTKTVIIVSVLGVGIWLSNVEPSAAMGFSSPPAAVIRVQPSYEHPSIHLK